MIKFQRNRPDYIRAVMWDKYFDFRWSYVAPLLTDRHRFFVTAYAGKLYAFGGYGNQGMEVYNPQTDSWSDAKVPTKEIKDFIVGCTFSSKYVH